jgi:hypothetical protein
MTQEKYRHNYLLFWIISLLAFALFYASYSSHKKQTEEMTVLKEQLKVYAYIQQDARYICPNGGEIKAPQVPSLPVIFSGALAGMLVLLAVQQTFSQIPQGQRPAEKDFIQTLIGRKHNEDLLGEMYHIYYLHKERSVNPDYKYLFKVLEACWKRISEYYQLSPIGTPGEGPVPYNPKEHVSDEYILPNEEVWVSQVGWKRGGRLILPVLVSKNPGQFMEGDWQ